MNYQFSSTPPESGADLRARYLVQGLFKKGEIGTTYWEIDRTVIGGAVPVGTPLTLAAPELLGSKSFCERREVGIINLGGPGRIDAAGKAYSMAPRPT